MCSDATSRITVSQDFAASRERVFDAFLNVDIARRFLFATPAGDMIAAAIDARAGGKFEFIEFRPEMGDVRHIGAYLEIDRPRRLVFTLGAPQFDPRMSVVTLEIRPSADGCDATLTAEGVIADYAERTRQGWKCILAGLLAAYDGGYAAGWREMASRKSERFGGRERIDHAHLQWLNPRRRDERARNAKAQTWEGQNFGGRARLHELWRLLWRGG